MLYVMDFSFDEWDDLVRRSRPIVDADMCYICEGGTPGCLASARGDGLVIYYAHQRVLRLRSDSHHWLVKLTVVDPEDRFHLVLRSTQMDAFQMLVEQLSCISAQAVIEYLWDIPEAIELLERHGSGLAPYLRKAHPFPFVEELDTSIWPFVKVNGDGMPSIHVYESS